MILDCVYDARTPKNKNKQQLASTTTSLAMQQWWQLESFQVLFYEAKVPTQMGISQYKDIATPLSTKDNNTTYQHFQMRFVTLF